MTENKRFTTDNGSHEDICLVDNLTGIEYESNFMDIVNLMNDNWNQTKRFEKHNQELSEENEQLKETINDLRAYDEEEYIEAKHLNNIYKEFGFDGIIKEVKSRLVYGTVTEMDNLIRISTGGWSDDESLVDVLTSGICRFHYHYVGYIVGGAFYFDPDKSIESFRKVKLIKEGQ